MELLAAPVSGNAKVIKAGRLSFVCSGPRAAFEQALPLLSLIAPSASYVGEGELARIVKICHNVFLGVVTQSLAEITVLAQKAGVPRHAFLEFMNQSVMGIDVPALQDAGVRKPRFQGDVHPQLLRKDMDLGLDAGRRYWRAVPLAEVAQSCAGVDRARRDRRGLREIARPPGRGVRASLWCRKTFRSVTVSREEEEAMRGWRQIGLALFAMAATLGAWPGLSQQAGKDRGPVHRRQRDRHPRAHGRTEARRALGPAGRHRQSSGGRAASIGAGIVAKSPADGYTLLVHSAAQAVNASIYPSLPYDTTKDFVEVATLGGQPNVLVVAPSTGYKSVADLIAAARRTPGALNFGSAGSGSGTHVNGEKFKLAAGIDVVHIPYKASRPRRSPTRWPDASPISFRRSRRRFPTCAKASWSRSA